MSCCCNHRSPCAPFTPAVNPDQGQCFPAPEVRDCEAPVLPVPVCPDPDAFIEENPDLDPPFRAISTLFDEACDPILDEYLQPITTESI